MNHLIPIWAAALGLWAAPAAAQPAGEPDASAIVITATRWPERADKTSRTVSSVGREELERRMPRSFPDAIRLEPGVSINQPAPGRAEPSIRGLGGSERLIMLDGVRLNDSVSGTVHAMSIEAVDRIEVLRGPGSVLYGGDAISGIVHLRSKRREDFSSPAAAGGRLAGSYSTADNGMQGRLELSGNRGGLGLFGGLSVQQFEDLSLGGNLGRALNTSYRTTGADAAADWRLGKALLRASFQHMTESDEPMYKQLSGSRRFGASGTYTEYLFDPDRRDLVILEAQGSRLDGPMDSVEAKLYWHRKLTGTRQQQASSVTEEVHANLVDTYGTRLQATSRPLDSWKLVCGLDGYTDRVGSHRTDINTRTRAAVDNSANSDFPDGSRYSTLGAFVFNQWRPAEDWVVEAGARFNRSWIDSTIRNSPNPASGFAFRDTNHAWTGGGGVAWKALPSLQMTAGVSQGFRSPDLNDTVALKASNSRYMVPSLGLRPEKSTQFEVGARQALGAFKQSLVFYHTLLKDFIDTAPGTWNGLSKFGTPQRPIYVNSNISAATVQGAEWEGTARLGRGLSLFGNASAVYGRDKSNGTAFSKIPAAMALAGLRWERSGARHSYADLYSRMAGRQNRLSPSDKTDGSMDPNGTPGWMTFNLRGGCALSRGLRVSAMVENLFDQPYREHGSAVDAPGVNFTSRVEILF